MEKNIELLTLTELTDLVNANEYLLKYYTKLAEMNRNFASQRFQEYEQKYRKYSCIKETIINELEKRISEIIDEKDLE